MKTLLLSSVALLALATTASAADLAARPYTKAPPLVAVGYNWTGFYIGLSGGYGWGQSDYQFAATPLISSSHNTSGGFGGGQIGYNWQMNSPWVFGIEADGHGADINGSALCPNPAFVCGTNTRTLASLRGRIGYAASSVLFYGTGGAGYASTRYTALTPAGVAGVGQTGTFTTDRVGYAAGAGIEWGFAPNWSAKVEYMHYGFDRVTAPIGTLGAAGTTDVRLNLDTVKAGINYRFGGPVVARY